MDRSRKSQIASAAGSREQREAEKNGLTSGKKLQRRGRSYACAQQCHPGVAARNGKNGGGGVGGCNPLASLEQPGPDEPLETCFTHVCGHIMACHDLYDCIPITFAPHWCFSEE